MLDRRWFAPLLVFACAAAANSAAADDAAFSDKVRPLLAKYCLGCHSTKEKKGELDLERFGSIATARGDLKPWQSMVEMLDSNEMPPKEKPQPTADERKWLADWARQFVAAEARARAGDPGRVALRRLSNAEYDATIRDLTGVDLRPTREFPADGAAGEGFTNAAEALSMSPALVDKYFAAAKAIADHAVLLPDGIRFSPSPNQRDWVDEALKSLHGLYDQYSEAEGRLPLRRYLAATVQHRAALATGKESLADVARQEHLSAKYLQTLWTLLNDGHRSFVLDGIRARWKTATPADVPALAAQLEAWQKAVWTFENNAAGLYEPWQKPKQPLVESQTLRLKLTPAATQNDVTLYLSARNLGQPGDKMHVIWDKPRFELANQPPLLLRDLPAVAEATARALHEQFAESGKYLGAVAEWARGGATVSLEGLAKERGLNANRLQRWIDVVGLHRDLPGPLETLDQKIVGDASRPFINGWGNKSADTLPSLVSNSSNQAASIPGTVPAHKVAMHPAPKEYVAVAWRSPIDGDVRLATKVADAHAGCGNGVAWWLEVERPARRERLVGGEFDDGKAAEIAPRELHVQAGDVICLAVGARNGDHVCDLTLVDLAITELGDGKRSWSLSGDVADTVLAGNPHADRLGNKDVWRFCKGQDNSTPAAPAILPAGSTLARWRETLDRGAPLDELARLAERVQQALTASAPPAASDPDAALHAALVSPGSRLVEPIDPAKVAVKPIASGATASRYGLDPSRFGKRGTGQTIDEASLLSESPTVMEIRLPAALVANREFVVDARLDPASAGDGLVQLQASTTAPAPGDQMLDAPILVHADAKARAALDQSVAEFRQTFPIALCFGRIVPQDPDGITLRMFCREDEPFSRLMLGPDEQQRLERLWSELKYIGREGQKEQEAYPLFMGFASQVGLVPRFEPLREPIRQRAEEFKQELLASEPKHLDALLEFASRAYRRPLAEAEKSDLLGLYQTLRKKGVPHEEAIRDVLVRALVSPAFLFHFEKSPPGKSPQPVDDWELASRLSYFLWSSLPDDELRRAAASGKLHEPAVLEAQTRRMLKDQRTRSLAIEFGTQWIHVRGFDEMKEKNERLFPTFDAPMRAAIYEESIRFFQDLFQSDRRVADILDANYTFLNETLAKHYGIPDIHGPEWRRVEGVKKYGRGGILGFASVQASEAGASRTSPVLRGNWVVETLLGEKLPRPPPNVPKLPEEETGNDGLSMRQLVTKHTSVAQCAVCHVRIDPFGFSLERYDAIGRLRDKDLGGTAVDTKVKLRDGTEFDGIDGLRKYLLTKKRDVVVRLFCRRLLGYALGRATTPTDQPTIDDMIAALDKNEGRISAAVLVIVNSPQFRLIRGADFMENE